MRIMMRDRSGCEELWMGQAQWCLGKTREKAARIERHSFQEWVGEFLFPGSLKKVFIDNTIHEAVAGIIMGEDAFGRKEGSKSEQQ